MHGKCGQRGLLKAYSTLWFMRVFPVRKRDKNSNDHQDLSDVCVYQDVCYILPALFAHGAAVHPADVPIRPIHLFTHPVDFPITPTQPHTLLAVIRPTCSPRLTAAHRCAYCVRNTGS